MKTIKILETVNKKFKNRDYSKVSLSIFTNRLTYSFCQEFISQNRAGLIQGSILNLGTVEGKPIYQGEQVPENKLKVIEKILKNGCK